MAKRKKSSRKANSKKRDIRTLAFLVLLLLLLDASFFGYPFLNEKAQTFFATRETESAFVYRVVDGDTVATGNQNVRLLGINTPERGELYHDEAKEFLESKVLNKNVTLEFGKERYDIYNRTLAYVLLDKENVNIEIVENGFANYYFPEGKDIYYGDFRKAWNLCLENGENLCEKSEYACSECIELKEVSSERDEAVFHNKCSLRCDITGWGIKDEGRKSFIFPRFFLEPDSEVTIVIGNGTNTNDTLFWKGETYVWTSTGDTLFLRDPLGKLVLWESY